MLATLAAATPAPARDRWLAPVRAVRVLHRTTHHPDGAPLVLHAAYIDLCDPAVAFRVTAPEEARQPVSRWARRAGVAVAINGDFFDGHPSRPLGPTRGRGVWWPPRPVFYYGALVAMGDGLPVRIEDIPEEGGAGIAGVGPEFTEVLASQEHVVSRGQVRLSRFVNHGGRNPRSGLGLSADGHTLILVAIDGRRGGSAGATTPELARALIELGAYEGVRLDGGGSSSLFVRGVGVVNTPSDGFERAVANHLGITVRTDAAPGQPAARCAATRTGP
jgi:hypothetical protein